MLPLWSASKRSKRPRQAERKPHRPLRSSALGGVGVGGKEDVPELVKVDGAGAVRVEHSAVRELTGERGQGKTTDLIIMRTV